MSTEIGDALEILRGWKQSREEQLKDQNKYTSTAWVPKVKAELAAVNVAIAAVEKMEDTDGISA